MNHLKKTYTKPDLFFENFSLMGSIANTCSNGNGLVNSAELGPCGFKDENAFGDLIVFSTGTGGGCQIGGIGDDMCYGTPNDAGFMFGS